MSTKANHPDMDLREPTSVSNNPNSPVPASPDPTRRAQNDPRPHQSKLHWQSQAVLLLLVPITAVWVTLQAGQLWYARDPALWQGAAISVVLAALVLITRAATPGAALTGGIFTAALWLQTPSLHTALWPLLALLVLTFGATRFGRHRKEAMGIAEPRRGRTASQVAANLGVAALAGIPLSAAHVFTSIAFGGRAAMIAMLAAMAEATADTVSSELGQILGGPPRMITNLRSVPAGTDGAISLAGTLCGSVAAAIVIAVAVIALPMFPRTDALLALVAGIAGTLIDSLLGAIPERKGWLNNDAVNTISTLAAALIGAALTHPL
jgi:uncharacterized protein (TIGR00297 family)